MDFRLFAIFQCLCTVFSKFRKILPISVEFCRFRSDFDEKNFLSEFHEICQNSSKSLEICRNFWKFMKFWKDFAKILTIFGPNACLLGPSGHPSPLVVDSAEKSGSGTSDLATAPVGRSHWAPPLPRGGEHDPLICDYCHPRCKSYGKFTEGSASSLLRAACLDVHKRAR